MFFLVRLFFFSCSYRFAYFFDVFLVVFEYLFWDCLLMFIFFKRLYDFLELEIIFVIFVIMFLFFGLIFDRYGFKDFFV